MPLSDSSQTYMRAVWPKPSPAVLRLTFAAGIFEVSRFSCMKYLGVSGVFDYAGLSRNSHYRPCPCCLPRIYTASASGLYLFAAQLPTPPILYLRFTASLTVAAQDSRPSGSLLLPRKALSSSTTCRFNPAHVNRDYTVALKLVFVRSRCPPKLAQLRSPVACRPSQSAAQKLSPGEL